MRDKFLAINKSYVLFPSGSSRQHFWLALQSVNKWDTSVFEFRHDDKHTLLDYILFLSTTIKQNGQIYENLKYMKITL